MRNLARCRANGPQAPAALASGRRRLTLVTDRRPAPSSRGGDRVDDFVVRVGFAIDDDFVNTFLGSSGLTGRALLVQARSTAFEPAHPRPPPAIC
jgi:hypothetical protein